jgi:hypothetical protein
MTDAVRQLQRVFDESEPTLRLKAYLTPEDEAHFQILDEDNVRIGTMVCRGVRMLCVSTDSQAYSQLDSYDTVSLPNELGWLRGCGKNVEGLLFLVMPSKLTGDLAKYSHLPRDRNGVPTAYVACRSVAYEAEDDPGFGA